MKIKKLHVKRTSNYELVKKWGLDFYIEGELFIRCNAKGEVNWDKAPLYFLDELLIRGNTKIIKP